MVDGGVVSPDYVCERSCFSGEIEASRDKQKLVLSRDEGVR